MFKSTWEVPPAFRRDGSEERVISTAAFQAVAEFLQVGDPVEMDKGCRHHQDVENLMRLEL